MGKKPKLTKVGYSLKATEAGDVARGYLSRTSGITFEVAPPSTPPPTNNILIDDNNISNFYDDLNAAGSGVVFVDDAGKVTLPG